MSIDFKKDNPRFITLNDNNIMFKIIQRGEVNQIEYYINNYDNKIWYEKDAQGFTVLHRACFLNSTAQIKTLITSIKNKINKKGEDINKLISFINEKTKEDITALHYSCYRGNIEIITFLIENGADITAKTKDDIDMLSMGAKGDQPNTMIYFKEKYKIDINQKNSNGMTPLHFASGQFAENSVSFLLSWGANPNAQDNNNKTPLHYASKNFSMKIIKKLFHKGANKNIIDNNYKTAFDYAKEKNNMEINLLFKDRNICEILFFRPEISKTKCKNLNMFIFIIVHIFTAMLSFIVIQPIINNLVLTFIYIGLFCIVIVMFIVLCFSDPGRKSSNKRTFMLDIVERGENVKEYCPYCCMKKCSDVKHCIICNFCVEKFDHHCFWVGNCIGKNNYYKFLFFLVILNVNTVFNGGIAFTSIYIYLHLFYLGFFIKQSSKLFITKICSNCWVYNQQIIYFINILIFIISVLFIIPLL